MPLCTLRGTYNSSQKSSTAEGQCYLATEEYQQAAPNPTPQSPKLETLNPQTLSLESPKPETAPKTPNKTQAEVYYSEAGCGFQENSDWDPLLTGCFP